MKHITWLQEYFPISFIRFQTKYMLGLSATPHRKDGLGKVLLWFFGPIIVDIKRKENKPMVKWVKTDVSSFDEKLNRCERLVFLL